MECPDLVIFDNDGVLVDSERLANGILVITIPKVAERRGHERRIPVTSG